MSNVHNYLQTLEWAYHGGTNNHPEHNPNPLYWDVLLKDVKTNPDAWEGKYALDFGCGKGRNVTNLKSLAKFARIDGVDISQNNIDHCRLANSNKIVSSFVNNVESVFYKNNGGDLRGLTSDTYDFVMSTIVFQHICVHELRIHLKREIHRVMKDGGIFSFQMGYGDKEFDGHGRVYGYYDNNYNAENSNGADDVRVTDPNQLISDLESIGFKNVTYQIEEPWADGGHPNWIYVRCEK